MDGILRLYSKNAQADRDIIHQDTEGKERRRSVLPDDGTPFRQLYLKTNDVSIYTAVSNFFKASTKAFWGNANDKSYIRKTVGIQGLFDTMRLILKNFAQDKNISEAYFEKFLMPSADGDFSDKFFQASGIGRTHVAKVIQIRAGLVELNESNSDYPEYKRLCGK